MGKNALTLETDKNIIAKINCNGENTQDSIKISNTLNDYFATIAGKVVGDQKSKNVTLKYTASSFMYIRLIRME